MTFHVFHLFELHSRFNKFYLSWHNSHKVIIYVQLISLLLLYLVCSQCHLFMLLPSLIVIFDRLLNCHNYWAVNFPYRQWFRKLFICPCYNTIRVKVWYSIFCTFRRSFFIRCLITLNKHRIIYVCYAQKCNEEIYILYLI